MNAKSSAVVSQKLMVSEMVVVQTIWLLSISDFARIAIFCIPWAYIGLLATAHARRRGKSLAVIQIRGWPVTCVGSVTVTLAEADWFASACDTAVTVTLAGLGTAAGAMDTPPVEMVTIVAFPPVKPFTCQVPPVFPHPGPPAGNHPV